MLVKPNSTRLRGKVVAVRNESNGSSAELDVLVIENLSSSPETDFLKPTPDQTITLYRRGVYDVAVGDLIEAEAELRAGPFGQRIIGRNVAKVAAKPARRSSDT